MSIRTAGVQSASLIYIALLIAEMGHFFAFYNTVKAYLCKKSFLSSISCIGRQITFHSRCLASIKRLSEFLELCEC